MPSSISTRLQYQHKSLIDLIDGLNDEQVRRPVNHLFLFIGAEPNTDWLDGSGVSLDANGFVLTGEDAGGGRHILETTQRGVFAIGDVRAKSVKRVAAAVGEGAKVVAALHGFLARAKPNLSRGAASANQSR